MAFYKWWGKMSVPHKELLLHARLGWLFEKEKTGPMYDLRLCDDGVFVLRKPSDGNNVFLGQLTIEERFNAILANRVANRQSKRKGECEMRIKGESVRHANWSRDHFVRNHFSKFVSLLWSDCDRKLSCSQLRVMGLIDWRQPIVDPLLSSWTLYWVRCKFKWHWTCSVLSDLLSEITWDSRKHKPLIPRSATIYMFKNDKPGSLCKYMFKQQATWRGLGRVPRWDLKRVVPKGDSRSGTLVLYCTSCREPSLIAQTFAPSFRFYFL